MRLIHYADKPIGEIYSVAQHEDSDMKPRGLWVSVEGDDDWKSWCEAENFSLNRLAVPHEVRLSDSANVLRLASAFEIDALTKEYGVSLLSGRDYPIHVRWNEIAKNYQGIIIAPYIWSRRLDGGSPWYYGWDCASGCIWDASAIDSVTVLKEAA